MALIAAHVFLTLLILALIYCTISLLVDKVTEHFERQDELKRLTSRVSHELEMIGFQANMLSRSQRHDMRRYHHVSIDCSAIRIETLSKE